jgi:hypothetical protein
MVDIQIHDFLEIEMKLDFNGIEFNCEITDESFVLSKHTNNQLEMIKVIGHIYGEEENEKFLSLIKQAQKNYVPSVNNCGETEKQYKIGQYSHSFRDNSYIYTHTLELIEVENLVTKTIIIGPLTIHPYHYFEDYSGDLLTIKLKVELTEAEYIQISKMQLVKEDYAVIRKGINENPLPMHFGLCYWSQNNEIYKYSILLVEAKDEDEPNELASTFKWLWTVRDEVADLSVRFDSLLSLLKDKNIININELSLINQSNDDKANELTMNFYKVNNIDLL